MINVVENCKIDKKYYIEDGIIMVHKPVGISSFGLVSKLKKILRTKKIGHAGTLDPLATGLMIIGVGSGTKKMKNYVGLDKVYIADILIGRSTTTGDMEGEIVEEKITNNTDMDESLLNNAIQSFVGKNYYKAPLYSAVKVLGKPLYKYAREGKVPSFIPEKEMNLKRVKILNLYRDNKIHILRIRAEVGSGTYMRTLAEEFGKKIDYPASLKSLYRISIDNYLDKDSFYINKKSVIIRLYSLIRKGICKFFLKQEE